MSKNWDRQYRVKVGIPGQVGFEVGGTTDKTGMPLHVTFSIEKSGASSNNSGTITIYNLNENHRNMVEKEGCTVELMAGYGSNLPLIFAGNISKARHEPDNADNATKIEAIDGLVPIRDTFIGVSYGAGVNGKTIMDYAASQMGVSVAYSESASQILDSKKFNSGFSAIGPAKNVLNSICSTCGLTWSIQSGVLQIVVAGQPISKRVYVISPDTGLIDKPKRITISSSGNSSESYEGWEVSYMLNGAIGVDDYVKLESKYVSGFFKVYKVSISGDNFGDDWKCTAQLREVKG